VHTVADTGCRKMLCPLNEQYDLDVLL